MSANQRAKWDWPAKRMGNYLRSPKVDGTYCSPDRNMEYQQNLAGRDISILILCAKSNRVRELLPLMPACAQALVSIRAGEIVEVGA